MKIVYKGVQKRCRYGTEYHGTKITIVAKSREEWLRIQAALGRNRVMKMKGTHFSSVKWGRWRVTFWGYDGFLASCIENRLTGTNPAGSGKPLNGTNRFYLGEVEEEDFEQS